MSLADSQPQPCRRGRLWQSSVRRSQRAARAVQQGLPAPTHKPIVERLVRTIAAWSILPLQPIADHVDDPADDAAVIDPWFTVRARKMRTDARHLLFGQQKQVGPWRLPPPIPESCRIEPWQEINGS